MSGVTIEEFGMKFAAECAKLYWSNCWYPVIFIIGLLCTLKWGRKRNSRIFIGYTAFLLLTVYNPLIVKIIVEKLNFQNEYYRFFWILPVILAVAYYGVQVVVRFKKNVQRAAAVLAVAAAFVLLGNPLQGVVTHFAFAENLYKVPNDLRGVCDVIHQLKGDDMPGVIFEGDLNYIVRQYDAGIRLVIDRDVSLYRAGNKTSASYNEDWWYYKRQKTLLDVVDYYIYEDPEAFRDALVKTRTDLLVISKEDRDHEFYEAAGCERAAESGPYYIYSFDWES